MTAKEAKRQYQREWARKNPDKIRAINERYWERVAARMEAATKEGKSNNENQNDTGRV